MIQQVSIHYSLITITFFLPLRLPPSAFRRQASKGDLSSEDEARCHEVVSALADGGEVADIRDGRSDSHILVRGPAQCRANGQVKIFSRRSRHVVRVVLDLGPGESRQLDGFANVVEGG